MMEAAPSAPLIVPQAHFLLELRIIGSMRQRSLARSTSPRKLMFSGSVESQYLVGSASPSGHSISSHSGDRFSGTNLLYPTLTRTRAKREDS